MTNTIHEVEGYKDKIGAIRDKVKEKIDNVRAKFSSERKKIASSDMSEKEISRRVSFLKKEEAKQVRNLKLSALKVASSLKVKHFGPKIAGAGALAGGASFATYKYLKSRGKIKESEMFKEYLGEIVSEVLIKNKSISPEKSILVLKEFESMSESDCKKFLNENLKVVVTEESKNFKKKVSDHIAPRPSHDDHMKKDARPTSKYVKQKKEVSKMLSGIKKKFREQVSYSILKSVKEPISKSGK